MNLPSREQCEGWDQAQVAFFMSKNRMEECAATVIRLNINGQRLLNMSDSEISKFSLIHQPQLQKIVQDIKKNDSGFLNKLRRLKSKPLPKVPARDYREDDQLSEPDYDNELYEDPHEEHDDSYEPPPSQRVFSTTPSSSFARGEYLDNHHSPPHRPPNKPKRPGKPSKQLPPQPNNTETDEDYIDPDSFHDDDNYVEPEEDPTINPTTLGFSNSPRESPALPMPSAECPPRPTRQHKPTRDFYEVGEKERNLSLPTRRPSPMPTTSQSHSLPPIPSPRMNARKSPVFVQESAGEDEYEVCDHDNGSSDKSAEGPPPPLLPKPLPRERSPKTPMRPKLELKHREFESRTLPLMHAEPKPTSKTFTLDLKRPKMPLPNLCPGPDRGSVASQTDSIDTDNDAHIHNKSWYAGACDRKTADDFLSRSNKDGAFMVRKSSGQDAQQPYTLVVLFKGRVYNIPVRFIPATQQYALGREKRGEEYFNSVSHIIENHQRLPMVLIDSQTNCNHTTKLSYPMKP